MTYAALAFWVATTLSQFGPGRVSYFVVSSDSGGGGSAGAGSVSAAPQRSASMKFAGWDWQVAGWSVRWRMWWDLPTSGQEIIHVQKIKPATVIITAHE